ncbi:hypothetical protein ACHQM5_026744 [Ranunculus cassubicifolius]
MADYKYMLQDKSKPVSNNNTSFTTTHTDGDFVTKTETTVEYVRVPAATTQGPADTTLSASQQQPSRVGALSNLYWWCKPIYSGNNGGFDYGKPNGTGIHNYYKPSDAGVYKQIDNSKQERSVIRSDGWDKNNLGKEAQSKGIPLTKPTILVDQLKNAQFVVVPTQGYLQQPMGSTAEVLLPSIDSAEAARRYGGFTTSPIEAYVPPAIDSREAAYKYRGQEL